MTKYTAEDFANAKFAEHPDGRTARRIESERGTVFAWSVERAGGEEDYCGDEYLAAHGWVPVPTKPQITESQFSELSEDIKNRTTILACALERVGIKIIPDPEPTNTERLQRLYDNWSQSKYNPPFGEWADSIGVTAPKEDN